MSLARYMRSSDEWVAALRSGEAPLPSRLLANIAIHPATMDKLGRVSPGPRFPHAHVPARIPMAVVLPS